MMTEMYTCSALKRACIRIGSEMHVSVIFCLNIAVDSESGEREKV